MTEPTRALPEEPRTAPAAGGQIRRPASSHRIQSLSGNGVGPRCLTATIQVRTSRYPDFVDITDHVREVVAKASVRDGFAVVFSRHTTAAIRINENESCFRRDMEKVLHRLAPANAYYEHNDLSVRTENLTDDEDLNGHSHCLHMLMGASEAIPIVNGSLSFGRWQRVFLVELDKPRDREVLVQVFGM